MNTEVMTANQQQWHIQQVEDITKVQQKWNMIEQSMGTSGKVWSTIRSTFVDGREMRFESCLVPSINIW
jgi:hypothetical protein